MSEIFIKPPLANEDRQGGFKAKARTNEALEVAIDNESGKAYAEVPAYSQVTGKPKLNGIEISGNKDFEDYKFNEWASENQLRFLDTIYCTIVGQTLANDARQFDGRSAQGMCCATINGNKCIMTVFLDSADKTGANNKLVLYNLETGALIKRAIIKCGHGNSCTFDPVTKQFLIASAGGDSTYKNIVVVDSTLKFVKEVDINDSPWGIAYNNDEYYVFVSGSKIKVFNRDFELQRTINIQVRPNSVYQGLAASGNFLYVPHGNTQSFSVPGDAAVNMIDIYTKEGVFFKSARLTCGLEIEELDFIDGEMYMQFNYQRAGVIFKGTLVDQCQELELNYPIDMDTRISAFSQTIYFDETYYGFFMDGSEEHPWSSVFFLPQAIYPLAGQVFIHLLSDTITSGHGISIDRSGLSFFRIYGHNHKTCGVSVRSIPRLVVNDLECCGRTPASDACFISYAAYTYCENLTVSNTQGTLSTRGIECESHIELVNCKIKDNYSRNGIYIPGTGYVQNMTIENCDNLNPYFSPAFRFDSASWTEDWYGSEGYYLRQLLTIVNAETGLDISKVKVGCTLSVLQTDAPSIVNGPPIQSPDWLMALDFKLIRTNTMRIIATTFQYDMWVAFNIKNVSGDGSWNMTEWKQIFSF